MIHVNKKQTNKKLAKEVLDNYWNKGSSVKVAALKAMLDFAKKYNQTKFLEITGEDIELTNTELFKKVYIKSEADLPKHEQFLNKIIIYHCKESSDENEITWWNAVEYQHGYSSTWDEYFLKRVDWYLLPIELKLQVPNKNKILIIK